MVTVSIHAMGLVLRLCEQQQAEIAGHVLKMHFRELGDELIAAGALVETTPTRLSLCRSTSTISQSSGSLTSKHVPPSIQQPGGCGPTRMLAAGIGLPWSGC